MNIESDNPNPIDDDQLDALLREVHVPADLKSELLSIADDEPAVTKVTTPSRGMHSWHGALAASLAAIALFGTWAYWAVNTSGTSSLPNGTIAERDSEGDTTSPEAAQLLAEMEALNTEFEMVLASTKLDRLEQELSEMKSTPTLSLSRDEVLAITFAIADQTAVELGSSRDEAISDMRQVIERYPNTQGAKIAHEFIKTSDKENKRKES